MSSLVEDCLRIIFSELQEGSLYSCILVNRFWCQTGVRILWKDPYNDDISNITSERYQKRCNKLYNTMIYLLPVSSKQLLIDNNVILPSTVSSNEPLFNYMSFSSVISLEFIRNMSITLTKNEIKCVMLEREIFKLFIKIGR